MNPRCALAICPLVLFFFTCKILQQQMASTSGATKIMHVPSRESCLMRSYASMYRSVVMRTIAKKQRKRKEIERNRASRHVPVFFFLLLSERVDPDPNPARTLPVCKIRPPTRQFASRCANNLNARLNHLSKQVADRPSSALLTLLNGIGVYQSHCASKKKRCASFFFFLPC